MLVCAKHSTLMLKSLYALQRVTRGPPHVWMILQGSKSSRVQALHQCKVFFFAHHKNSESDPLEK